MQRNDSLWKSHNNDSKLRQKGTSRTYFEGLEPITIVYPKRGKITGLLTGGTNVFEHTISRSKFEHTGGYYPIDRDPYADALRVIIKVDPNSTPEQLNARKGEFLKISRDKGVPIIVQWPGFGKGGTGIIFNAGRVPNNDMLIYGSPN